MMKSCTKCKIPQAFCVFTKNRKRKDGLATECKQCNHQYYLDNAERIKQRSSDYGKATLPQRRERYHKRHRENPELIRSEWNKYRSKNRERRSRSGARYYQQNKEKIRERAKIKRMENVELRLRINLRTRLRRCLQGRIKSDSALWNLGCSLATFRQHLEHKFQPGMTWENWGQGKGTWQVDHIMPLSAFNLLDIQHRLLACYYLNLQPLWYEDNLRKGGKLPTTEIDFGTFPYTFSVWGL